MEIKELASARSSAIRGSEMSDHSPGSPNVITSYRFDSHDSNGKRIKHPKGFEGEFQIIGKIIPTNSGVPLEMKHESARILESDGHDVSASD